MILIETPTHSFSVIWQEDHKEFIITFESRAKTRIFEFRGKTIEGAFTKMCESYERLSDWNTSALRHLQKTADNGKDLIISAGDVHIVNPNLAFTELNEIPSPEDNPAKTS